MPWMTGSFMPMPSTRRRTTWMMRASQFLRVSAIFFSTAPGSFVMAGLAATIVSRSLSLSTPSVKEVPPLRSRPKRSFPSLTTTPFSSVWATGG